MDQNEKLKQDLKNLFQLIKSLYQKDSTKFFYAAGIILIGLIILFVFSPWWIAPIVFGILFWVLFKNAETIERKLYKKMSEHKIEKFYDEYKEIDYDAKIQRIFGLDIKIDNVLEKILFYEKKMHEVKGFYEIDDDVLKLSFFEFFLLSHFYSENILKGDNGIYYFYSLYSKNKINQKELKIILDIDERKKYVFYKSKFTKKIIVDLLFDLQDLIQNKKDNGVEATYLFYKARNNLINSVEDDKSVFKIIIAENICELLISQKIHPAMIDKENLMFFTKEEDDKNKYFNVISGNVREIKDETTLNFNPTPQEARKKAKLEPEDLMKIKILNMAKSNGFAYSKYNGNDKEIIQLYIFEDRDEVCYDLELSKYVSMCNDKEIGHLISEGLKEILEKVTDGNEYNNSTNKKSNRKKKRYEENIKEMIEYQGIIDESKEKQDDIIFVDNKNKKNNKASEVKNIREFANEEIYDIKDKEIQEDINNIQMRDANIKEEVVLYNFKTMEEFKRELSNLKIWEYFLGEDIEGLVYTDCGSEENEFYVPAYQIFLTIKKYFVENRFNEYIFSEKSGLLNLNNCFKVVKDMCEVTNGNAALLEDKIFKLNFIDDETGEISFFDFFKLSFQDYENMPGEDNIRCGKFEAMNTSIAKKVYLSQNYMLFDKKIKKDN